MDHDTRVMDDLPSEVLIVACARGFALPMEDAEGIARTVRAAGVLGNDAAFRALVVRECRALGVSNTRESSGIRRPPELL